MPWNFIKKETLTQKFSCEFCEISQNTLFTSQNTSSGCFCWRLKFQFSSHTARSSRSQIFIKIGVLINFVMLTRNRLSCSFILIKLQALTLLKNTQTQMLYSEYWKMFKNNFFYRTLLVAASLMRFETFYKIPVECWFLMWSRQKTEILLEIKSTSFKSQELVEFTLTFMMHISRIFE